MQDDSGDYYELEAEINDINQYVDLIGEHCDVYANRKIVHTFPTIQEKCIIKFEAKPVNGKYLAITRKEPKKVSISKLEEEYHSKVIITK